MDAFISRLFNNGRQPSTIPTTLRIPHPYFPVEADLVNYVPNNWNVLYILGIFGGAIAAVMGLTQWTTRALNPNLKKKDKALIQWFMVSGLIHLIIEGYFSVNHMSMPSKQDYLGQGWKEYSKSDSRYLTVDAFLVCMETVTAFAWGPLCLLTTWLILVNSPWRHPTQALISTGQLYGNILYYSTSVFDYYTTGISYSQPSWIVYGGYFIGMNLVWIVIPLYCLSDSMRATRNAFARANSSSVPKSVRIDLK